MHAPARRARLTRRAPTQRDAMLVSFFTMLRATGVPVSLTEFLALLEALRALNGR